MGHIEDEIRQFYTLINNKGYLIPPYMNFVRIGTGLRLLNAVTDTVTIAQPNFANRVSVFYYVEGTLSSGQIRMECAAVANATNFGIVGSANTNLNVASGGGCILVTNDLGPYHFFRCRVVSTLNGGGTVSVYVSFCR